VWRTILKRAKKAFQETRHSGKTVGRSAGGRKEVSGKKKITAIDREVMTTGAKKEQFRKESFRNKWGPRNFRRTRASVDGKEVGITGEYFKFL